MIKTREQMMNEVIRKFGFEHETTILFCKLCETEGVWDEIINIGFNYIMRKK